MKKISLFIFLFMVTFCAYAQNLYIGSFYVTSTTEESLYGDGNDKWAKRMPVISDMFNFEQPDVLGLQSLTEAQLGQLTKRLTNYNAAGDILYNKNTLILDTCGVITDMPEGSSCSSPPCSLFCPSQAAGTVRISPRGKPTFRNWRTVM